MRSEESVYVERVCEGQVCLLDRVYAFGSLRWWGVRTLN